LLVALAWGDLGWTAAGMNADDMSSPGMASGMSAAPAPWTGGTFALMFLMWWIMMIGMMIPSALPMILLHERVQKHNLGAKMAVQLSALFTLGYLLAWALFSLAATTMQWGLHVAGWLSPMSLSVGTTLGAALFAAAGIYQLTPIKNACLKHCRSPAEFLVEHRRAGLAGAMLTGGHHGLYCVGCCAVLMLLLFTAGVMNLIWVASLAVFVMLEKLAPGGAWIARGSGVALLGIAAWLLLQ
jgi:predicted metal-binding membrane protein